MLLILCVSRFNLKEVTQGYGLTEATMGVLLAPKVNKMGSVGKIVPGMKVKASNLFYNLYKAPYFFCGEIHVIILKHAN